MDPGRVRECQERLQSKKKLDNSETNKVHTNWVITVRDEMGSEGNKYILQTHKTEITTHEKTGSPFLTGTLAEVNSHLSYRDSPSKTAMDLSCHVSSSKTIFEDADYFATHYLYKLMPITFEVVDETIIHIEHNYCNFGSSSIVDDNSINDSILSDADGRHCKVRKIKSGEGVFSTDFDRNEEPTSNSASLREEFLTTPKMDEEYSLAIQPLDLSLSVFHDQKSDKLLKDGQSNIPKIKTETRSASDMKQFDLCESNKENVTSDKKIEVTISRPGQKEYYQPCEVFLNDIARISPDLVRNDCYEIDIIDRTGQDLEKEKCRTYYIVSESTWHTFENSTERIILTNDLNIGEPIQNNKMFDKPTYLIFDQHSLTESLVKICENKGGSFKYTYLKESMPKLQDGRREVQDCSEFAFEKTTMEAETKADADHKPKEAKISKHAVMGESVETERDSATASKFVDKTEELETGGEACENSEEEKGEQTERQMPTEGKPDDRAEESDRRDGMVQDVEMKQESDLHNNVDSETVDEGAAIRDRRIVGRKRKKRRTGIDVPGSRVERNKRKSIEVKEESEDKVVEPSLKRVTRSSASLTEEVPRGAVKRRGKRNTAVKIEASVNKEKVVGLTEGVKAEKIRTETKSKENEKVCTMLMAVDRKRKRSGTDVVMRNGGSMRETRSTAKKKALEKVRSTRGRKGEKEAKKKV